jgi:hypothetical protein
MSMSSRLNSSSAAVAGPSCGCPGMITWGLRLPSRASVPPPLTRNPGSPSSARRSSTLTRPWRECWSRPSRSGTAGSREPLGGHRERPDQRTVAAVAALPR